MSFTNMELAERGRARIAAASAGEAPAAKPAFPFKWGECWKHCVEYRVLDFDAEVGFFLDVLGMEANALSAEYAMFTGPDRDFYFALVPADEVEPPTEGRTIRLGFMIQDIQRVAADLQGRGVEFEKPVQRYMDAEASLFTGRFRTPNGIAVDLWGMVE